VDVVIVEYNINMDAAIIFNKSAFKHGVTEIDIFRAFETFIYEDPVDEASVENKYLLLGFNTHGNLIEVMYNRIGEDAINVFHAMPCRRAFFDLLES
jgi:ASC-1-like (ASCH) protein